jgi:hypothetical protein
MGCQRRLRRLSLLALIVSIVPIVLTGCAARSSQTEFAAAPDTLAEAKVVQLISIWQEQLCRYIVREGNGDDAVLAQLRTLRSSNALRPARITFGVLDVGADTPERDGWDVQGVLVGRQKRGVFIRYVFVVGIVGYDGNLPTKIQDMRLVGLSPLAGTLLWETSAAAPASVARYRQAFSGGASANRFPGDDDNFAMTASPDRVAVQEIRSGADWMLKVRVNLRDTYGASVSSVRTPRGASAGDGCRRRG